MTMTMMQTTTRNELVDHIYRIESFINQKDFGGLDLWIKDDLYQAHPIFLLCYLHITSAWRDNLVMWETVKEQVSEAYGKKILKGL